MLINNYENLIGNTPLYRLNKYSEKYKLNYELYGKLEKYNPTGSIKDRASYYMIKDLLEKRIVKENDTIVISTSGNLGISLSFICKQVNLNLIVFMPENSSIERFLLMKCLNTKVIKVKKDISYDKLIEISKMYANRHGFYYLNQFDNINNIAANTITGLEIKRDLNDIDYIFCGIGSAGTIMGIKEAFKNTKTKIIGVKPTTNDFIPGLGTNFVPKNFNEQEISKIIEVTSKEAYHYQKIVNSTEGILIGVSSGAVLAAVTKIKKHELKNKKIVLIFPDSKERYLYD